MALPIILIVPATSHSSSHIPMVVDLGVVVVVVVVDVIETALVVSTTDMLTEISVAVLATSKSFSIEIGVVDGVGQPVNSVVALKILIDYSFFFIAHLNHTNYLI